MQINYGQTVEVFRQATTRDRFGDVERTSIGSVEHVVFQWASAASVGLRFKGSADFRETSELTAVMFFPRDHAIQVNSRDRLKMGGKMFQVIGDKAWDELMPATGHNFGYYMVQVEVVT